MNPICSTCGSGTDGFGCMCQNWPDSAIDAERAKHGMTTLAQERRQTRQREEHKAFLKRCEAAKRVEEIDGEAKQQEILEDFYWGLEEPNNA